MTPFIHDPNARLDYWWDWSRWLHTGETITAATAETDDPSITLSAANVVDGGKVTVWVQGGVAGTVARVTVHVVTSVNRQDDRSITLRVRDR